MLCFAATSVATLYHYLLGWHAPYDLPSLPKLLGAAGGVSLMAGTVGPMFVALHSALKLSSWVSLAFWSMVIVAVSGFIGRYLYTQVPELSSGRELEELDHERAFSQHRGRHPVAMSEIDRELWEHGQRAGRVAAHAGLLVSLGWLLIEDLRRPGRWWARRRRLGRVGVTGKARRDLVRRTGRMLLIQRGAVIAD